MSTRQQYGIVSGICASILAVSILTAFVPCASAATNYVDVKYPNGDSDGTSSKPWTNMAPAVTAFTNGTGHTVIVAAGLYMSTNAGGYETFGTNGYVVIPPTGNFSGNWLGGYKGWDGGSCNWSEANRVMPTTNVNTATMTVIDLTNANSRAFYAYDITRDRLTVKFEGLVFRNANVTQANYSGGALLLGTRYCTDAADAHKVNNCVFLNNRTTLDGGALYSRTRFGVNTNLQFIGNSAGGTGGGACLYTDYLKRTVSNIVCIGNSAGVCGGALFTVGDVYNGTFVSNTATLAGGAVNPGTLCTFYRCTFVGNVASNGAAIGCYSSSGGGVSGSCVMENCLVVSNRSLWPSGAIFLNKEYPQDGNPVNIILRHTTIADNYNGGAGNRIRTYNGFQNGPLVLSVTNCIIANNGPVGLSSSFPVAYTNFNIGIDYNVVYGQTTNYHGAATNALRVNDRNVDPEFVGGSDYQLKRRSPAMDSALNIGINIDLLGSVRPVGLGYDRGCYEMPEIPKGTVFSLR